MTSTPEPMPDYAEWIEIGRSRERAAIMRILENEAQRHEDAATDISDAAGGIFGDPTEHDDEIEMHRADAAALRRLIEKISARAPAVDEPEPADEPAF